MKALVELEVIDEKRELARRRRIRKSGASLPSVGVESTQEERARRSAAVYATVMPGATVVDPIEVADTAVRMLRHTCPFTGLDDLEEHIRRVARLAVTARQRAREGA